MMKVHGSCQCGQITYEAEVDPEKVTLCNCTDCQQLTGSAFRVSVPVSAQAFRLLTGTPKVYLKTADSGAKRRHTFCPNCGSPVSSSADTDTPQGYMLRVGSMAEKANLPPKRRIWCRSALAWGQDVSRIPGIEAQ